jgi:ankyrin repeat protein
MHRVQPELIMKNRTDRPAPYRSLKRALRLCATAIPIVFIGAVLIGRATRHSPGGDDVYLAASRPEPGPLLELIDRLPRVNEPDRLGFTPLAVAASFGRLDAVLTLLDAGAAPDAGHPLLGTPLMLALRNGHVETARALLGRGANVNAMCGGLDPLASAVMADNLECVNLVLAAGGDATAPGRRYRLLTLAAQDGDLTVMRRLLMTTPILESPMQTALRFR